MFVQLGVMMSGLAMLNGSINTALDIAPVEHVLTLPTQQWNQYTHSKIVKRFSTFLFKDDKVNPIKTKLLAQAQKNEVYALTDEEKVALLTQELVDSELVYGDVVKVLETKGDYTKVAVVQQKDASSKDGYVGWVFTQDLADIPVTYQQAKEQVIIVAPSITLKTSTETVTVSQSTYLPLIEETATHYVVQLLSGTATIDKKDAFIRGKAIDKPIETIVQLAKQHLGKRYVWAGTSSQGFDCSGFMYHLFRLVGIDLARDADEQMQDGQAVPLTDMQVGDLLFFKNEQGSIHHVGMYVGQGEMLHAPNEHATVSILKIKGTVYEKELIAVRRIIK